MGSGKFQGSFWGKAVEDWANLEEIHHHSRWDRMLSLLGVTKGTRLLDAGCGSGGGAILAAELDAEVFGVDASENMIAWARSRLPSGDFKVGELEELPYEPDFFDAVLASNSIQFTESPISALNELKRVSSPDAGIAISWWGPIERCDFREIVSAIAEIAPSSGPSAGPFAYSKTGVLEGWLEGAGLKIVHDELMESTSRYSDENNAIKAQLSAGVLQMAIGKFGEDRVREALTVVNRKHQQPGGEVEFNNVYRVTLVKRD